MTRQEIADIYGEDLLFIDPAKFDDCILGVGMRCGLQNMVVYDRAKMANLLIDEGMTFEEADEYISYNIEGAYVGEHTPLIVEPV